MNRLNIATMETVSNVLKGDYWYFESLDCNGNETYRNVISGLPVLITLQEKERFYNGELPEGDEENE